MSVKPVTIFKIWTSLLSIAFAALLLLNIVDRFGIGLSLFFTSLGICFIWLVYLGIGKLIDWAVNEEIKRRNLCTKSDNQCQGVN